VGGEDFFNSGIGKRGRRNYNDKPSFLNNYDGIITTVNLDAISFFW
jgi:hypothetical protein